MSSGDQDFKSFYKNFSKSQNIVNPKQTILRELNFDTVMRSGRVEMVVDWEKVFYSAMGIALLLKGLYFWTKW